MNTQLEALIRETIYAIIHKVKGTLDLFTGLEFLYYLHAKKTVVDLKAEKLRLEIALLKSQLPQPQPKPSEGEKGTS